MRFRCILFFVLIGYSIYGSSQEKVLDWTEYFTMISKADSLYEKGEFHKAAKGYSDAFKFNDQGYSPGDKYKAAKAWSKCGEFKFAIAGLKEEVGLDLAM